MAFNEIKIQLTKCILILYENEIWSGLKPEILERAIKRGKGFRRSEVVKKRQQKISPENCNCLTECENCKCGGND